GRGRLVPATSSLHAERGRAVPAPVFEFALLSARDYFFPSTALTVKSSNWIGAPEKGLPKTEARPAVGSSFSSEEIIQLSGSWAPASQTLPSIFHSPAFALRICKRRCVHSPDFHSKGTVALTSWSL